MKRSQLKAIVKECLVEILQEGINLQDMSGTPVEPRLVSDDRVRRKTVREASGHRPKKKIVRERVREVDADQLNDMVNTLTDDPLMTAILSDTAGTTLREQAANGHRDPSRIDGGSGIPAHADEAARIMYEVDPTDVFDGADGAWEKIAFAGMSEPVRPIPVAQHRAQVPGAGARQGDPTLDVPVTEAPRHRAAQQSAQPMSLHYDPYAPIDSEIVG